MARPIDENKIERIKQIAMELIVHKGYGGASISEIAKKANVAEGYLYRFYKGKLELVEDILNKNIDELISVLEDLIKNYHSISDIYEGVVRKMFEIAKTNPTRIQFIFVLMKDYNFSIEQELRERIFNLCETIRVRGVNAKILRSDIDNDEIFLMGLSYPVQYINYRLKNFFNNNQLGETEIQKILKVCENSLKYED